jgi:glycine cleavage system H protein
MSQTLNIPQDLRYTETHEWCRLENGLVTVGITHHAQELLGDLVYVELPELEQTVSVGQELCVVESVKAASDVYAPLAGRVIAINTALEKSPELVNQDPYGAGWLFKLQVTDVHALDNLYTAENYTEQVEG